MFQLTYLISKSNWRSILCTVFKTLFLSFELVCFQVSFYLSELIGNYNQTPKTIAFLLPEWNRKSRAASPDPGCVLLLARLSLTRSLHLVRQRQRRADTWKEPAWPHPAPCNSSHSRLLNQVPTGLCGICGSHDIFSWILSDTALFIFLLLPVLCPW